LAAQTARLDQAEAERYPSFRLAGSLGLQAATLGGLGDTTTHSLLGSITAPIFEAGRIRGDIEVQDALLEQARIAYQKTVLTALQDVENALVELSSSGRRRDELTLAVGSARQALELARHQYSAGLVDFQTVLDSQRTVLGLEDQLASSTGDHSTALIQLYKALGGGWTPGSAATNGKESS
jgi:outer membrane protein TolC